MHFLCNVATLSSIFHLAKNPKFAICFKDSLKTFVEALVDVLTRLSAEDSCAVYTIHVLRIGSLRIILVLLHIILQGSLFIDTSFSKIH